MHTGHFIEIDAAKNVTVRNCSFTNSHEKSPVNKEAINIDTPDLNTGGMCIPWSNPDKTPDNTVIIENCAFTNLHRGIGTHKYSQLKGPDGTWSVNCYHENIIIRNNTFTHMKHTGIFMMNWKNVTIKDNTFVDNVNCMNFRGVQAPFVLSGNDFGDCEITMPFGGKKRLIYNKPYTNNEKGGIYSPIYNDIGVTTVDELAQLNNPE